MTLLLKDSSFEPTFHLTVGQGVLRIHAIDAVQCANACVVFVPTRQLPTPIRPRAGRQHQPAANVSELLRRAETSCARVGTRRRAPAFWTHVIAKAPFGDKKRLR